jgi:hypothetical protein
VRIHGLLFVQSVVVVLVTINRLSNLTLSYVARNQFLRWVDLNNMLVLPLISLVAFYVLKKQLEYTSPAWNGRQHLLANLAFFIGVYLLGASYGDHELANYLHSRFCANGASDDICQIIIFNDDEFSHWVFFTGFVLVNSALLAIQVLFPHAGRLSGFDWGLLALNGLFIGLGIFANLAFEQIGFDLFVVALLAALSLGLLLRRGAQPLLVYYSTAYSLGLSLTFVYKTISG